MMFRGGAGGRGELSEGCRVYGGICGCYSAKGASEGIVKPFNDQLDRIPPVKNEKLLIQT